MSRNPVTSSFIESIRLSDSDWGEFDVFPSSFPSAQPLLDAGFASEGSYKEEEVQGFIEEIADSSGKVIAKAATWACKPDRINWIMIYNGQNRKWEPLQIERIVVSDVANIQWTPRSGWPLLTTPRPYSQTRKDMTFRDKDMLSVLIGALYVNENPIAGLKYATARAGPLKLEPNFGGKYLPCHVFAMVNDVGYWYLDSNGRRHIGLKGYEDNVGGFDIRIYSCH